MREDFSVPEEFQKHYELLWKKKAITKREYVELCLLAIKLSHTHWAKRQGLAYHLTGLWLRNKNITDDPILDDIGGEFGSLELPDHHIGTSEESVRTRWDEIAVLINEASSKYR